MKNQITTLNAFNFIIVFNSKSLINDTFEIYKIKSEQFQTQQ